LGCLKLTYHQKPELNIVSTEKELTFEKSVLKACRGSELTNHLNNVLATISDRKIWNSTDGNYEPVITMYADYYAFGMVQPGRSSGLDESRHLFNGMEADAEVSGDGNSYTTEFRQYDPRLGRWKSLDPLMHMFPSLSPYCAFDNNPIYFTDPFGLASEGEPDKVITKEGKDAHSEKGEMRRREETLRNMKEVADGTIVRFEYPDDEHGANHDYQYDAEKNEWNETFTYGTSTTAEYNVPVENHYTLKGSPRNLGGNVPRIAKAEPPKTDLNNDGIDPNPGKDQAGQEVKTDGINKKPTISGADGSSNDANGRISVLGRDLEPGETRYTSVGVRWKDALWEITSGTNYNRLDQIATVLQKNPNLSLTIVGNIAVGIGSESSTWDDYSSSGVTFGQLADYRTIVLYNYFITKGGIDASQLKRRRGTISTKYNGTPLNIKYNE